MLKHPFSNCLCRVLNVKAQDDTLYKEKDLWGVHQIFCNIRFTLMSKLLNTNSHSSDVIRWTEDSSYLDICMDGNTADQALALLQT